MPILLWCAIKEIKFYWVALKRRNVFFYFSLYPYQTSKCIRIKQTGLIDRPFYSAKVNEMVYHRHSGAANKSQCLRSKLSLLVYSKWGFQDENGNRNGQEFKEMNVTLFNRIRFWLSLIPSSLASIQLQPFVCNVRRAFSYSFVVLTRCFVLFVIMLVVRSVYFCI